jgi:hypothetical protein
MEVQLGWFYQSKHGTIVRIKREITTDAHYALIVSGIDPWDFYLVSSDGRDKEHALDPNPLLILESGSWLHDLTAAWKPGDGILAERLKEAGRKAV